MPPLHTRCKVVGCDRPGRYRKGLCGRHYGRFLRYGDPLGGRVSDGEPLAFFNAALANPTDECLVWPFTASRGYGQLRFEGIDYPVHRLALILTTGGDRPGMYAAHGPCHNTRCFNPRHLSWATPTENAAHKLRDGTAQRGSHNPHSKLSAEQVLEIRGLLANGVAIRELAERFDVSISAISLIKHRRNWAWLADQRDERDLRSLSSQRALHPRGEGGSGE